MIKTSCNKNLKLYLFWTSYLDPDLLSSIKKTVNNDFCRSMALEACLLDLPDVKLKIHFDPISPFVHLQGWVLLPRIVLGWKEGIGCSPPLRRTDPVIVLFHLKVKVKVIPKTSHLSVQGKQIDRSWQVIPDGKSWLSKIAIHNLQMGKTESWHIFAVYVEHSTQLNHQFLRRQNLTVSSSVRYLECVAVAVNQQSFKMRHLRIHTDRLFTIYRVNCIN